MPPPVLKEYTVDEPTNWAALKPKKMKGSHVKAELKVRGLDTGGNKDQLDARLIKQMKKEQAEEDKLAAIRKAEQAELVKGYLQKYAELNRKKKFFELHMDVAEEEAIRQAAARSIAQPNGLLPCLKCLAPAQNGPAPAPADATPPPPPKADAIPVSLFDDPDALLMTIDKGDVAVLKSSWLIKERAFGGRLLSRQELDKKMRSASPSERPFFTASEMREKLRTLGKDFGWMVSAHNSARREGEGTPTASHTSPMPCVARP
eukprot:5424026-Prymnesium_polylepis.1